MIDIQHTVQILARNHGRDQRQDEVVQRDLDFVIARRSLGLGHGRQAVDADAAPRGKILRIRPSGHAVELWRSTEQAVFSIAVDAEGRSLFGTGEPARLYEIEGTAVTLLASLDEVPWAPSCPHGRPVAIAFDWPDIEHRFDRR